MTRTLLRPMAYSLLGLSLAFVFLTVQKTSSGSPVSMLAATPLASPTPPPNQKPTLQRYNCGDAEHPDYITFNWTGQRPHGGWVGEVTYGSFVKKPIQAFDAKFVDPTNPKIIDWAYQAQDGSFLCRMTVNSAPLRNGSVTFGTCRDNNWPQLFCEVKGT